MDYPRVEILTLTNSRKVRRLILSPTGEEYYKNMQTVRVTRLLLHIFVTHHLKLENINAVAHWHKNMKSVLYGIFMLDAL